MTEEICVKPNVAWAQRKKQVFVTVEVSEPTDVNIDLQSEDKLCVSANGKDGRKYQVTLDLYGKVNKEGCKNAVTRHILIQLEKQEEESWPALLKERQGFVKVDWSRWVDSDDEKGMGEFDDFGDFGGGMGMGQDWGNMNFGAGMGGDDAEDDGEPSDEEPEDEVEEDGNEGDKVESCCKGSDASKQGDCCKKDNCCSNDTSKCETTDGCCNNTGSPCCC